MEYFVLTEHRTENQNKLIQCACRLITEKPMFTVNTVPWGFFHFLCICCPLNFLICHFLLPAVFNITWSEVIRKKTMWLLCHSNNITFTPATGASLIPAERGTHRVVFILLSLSSAVLLSASHFISYSLSGATNI